MLAARQLPIVMQFCYFLGHKIEIEAKNLELAKTGLILIIKALKFTSNGEKL